MMLRLLRSSIAWFVAVTILLCSFFTISASAEEVDADETLFNTQILQEITGYLEKGINVELAPGEVTTVSIPLSNGQNASLEVGCKKVQLQRGNDSYTYTYSSNGNYIFWGKINYGMIGSYSHRVNFTVNAVSPCCKFSITSASIASQQPSVGYQNAGSGITDIVNYSVGTSSYTHGYASYSLSGITTNLYSKILMNSFNAQKIQFTVYYSMSPIG